MTDRIPCPYVYANGRHCTGHIIRVEAIKADLMWEPDENGVWKLSTGGPRSHYHVYCSEKGNHAGYRAADSEHMKFYFGDLPADLRNAIDNA